MNGIQSQYLKKNKLMIQDMTRDAMKIEVCAGITGDSNLIDIKGIGAATVEILHEAGIKTQEQLKSTPIEEIKEIIKNPLTFKNIISFIEE